MENQLIEKTSKIKKFMRSLLLAIFLSGIFLVICLPFLENANNFPYTEKVMIVNINLWRAVVVFGILSTISTICIFLKKKERKITILFVWIFWAMGVCLISILSPFQLGIAIMTGSISSIPKLNFIDVFINFIAISPWFVWLFGVYYCRRVAMRLEMSGSNATLAGVFLPVLSIIIYFIFSYRKKEKEQKIKTLKIIGSIAVVVILVSVGIAYYITGMPEYSLYKFKQALVMQDINEAEKCLDINSIAEKLGASPDQVKERINIINKSVIEFKEENTDKSKNATFYVATELTGRDLETASIISYQDNTSSVLLEFNERGTKLFSELTSKNIGRNIAIYFDGQLISALSVREQLNGGRIETGGFDLNKIIGIVNRINEEKDSMVGGFKIKEKKVDGDFAEIIINKTTTGEEFHISMARNDDRHWKIIGAIPSSNIDNVILPAPEGEKVAIFKWKYKGKDYSLDWQLYDSYYKFYNSLPVQSVFNGESIIGTLEKRNELFITENSGDKTIDDLAQAIKSFGEKNNLNEDQIIELVASFVQTIPYDYEEYNNRYSGDNKIDYPYEVLYKNKGICSDKSYLAYSLLKNLGYGVALFQFPEDQHIAVGVSCPIEYSNYNSGYCFMETTSLGNKIGSAPNLSKEFGIATAKIELSDYSNDSTESDYNPLGKIEILNKIDGKVYTGIIETIATQKEIDNLVATINALEIELRDLRAELDVNRVNIGLREYKLDKLEKDEDPDSYDEYIDLYNKYKKENAAFNKDVKRYNDKLASYNRMIARYNLLIKNFYE